MLRLLLSVFLLFFGLSACSQGSGSSLENWMRDNGKIKALSTTAMIDDLVAKIGGDAIDHRALIIGEIDPHSYELIKGDEEKLSSAKIIFYNGLGLEHGASLRYHLEKHPHAIAIGEQIAQRAPDSILYVGRDLDPHVWMDVSLWAQAIDPIVEGLSRIAPEHTDLFKKNGEALRLEMMQVDQKIYDGLQQVPESKRFLVTSHDAFDYFARRYLAEPSELSTGEWQKRFEAPEGLAPEVQLSASDIQGIVDHLLCYRIKVLFPESNVSKDSLKKIVHACLKKGIEVKMSQEVLYGDAMGSLGSDADTYLKMMQHNARVLENEWHDE